MTAGRPGAAAATAPSAVAPPGGAAAAVMTVSVSLSTPPAGGAAAGPSGAAGAGSAWGCARRCTSGRTWAAMNASSGSTSSSTGAGSATAAAAAAVGPEGRCVGSIAAGAAGVAEAAVALAGPGAGPAASAAVPSSRGGCCVSSSSLSPPSPSRVHPFASPPAWGPSTAMASAPDPCPPLPSAAAPGAAAASWSACSLRRCARHCSTFCRRRSISTSSFACSSARRVAASSSSSSGVRDGGASLCGGAPSVRGCLPLCPPASSSSPSRPSRSRLRWSSRALSCGTDRERESVRGGELGRTTPTLWQEGVERRPQPPPQAVWQPAKAFSQKRVRRSSRQQATRVRDAPSGEAGPLGVGARGCCFAAACCGLALSATPAWRCAAQHQPPVTRRRSLTQGRRVTQGLEGRSVANAAADRRGGC